MDQKLVISVIEGVLVQSVTNFFLKAIRHMSLPLRNCKCLITILKLSKLVFLQ
jgi:hypothetical protein